MRFNKNYREGRYGKKKWNDWINNMSEFDERDKLWTILSGGVDCRSEDWREDKKEKKYYFKLFRRWRCDYGYDSDGNETKEFYKCFENIEVVERRNELKEVFELFRRNMNWNGEIYNTEVVKEFDKFMKFRDRMWREDWSYRFKGNSWKDSKNEKIE